MSGHSILIGHDEPWSEWRAAMAGPRMHHGWILSGNRGIGKASFATDAARSLVALDGSAQPAGDHPDIIRLCALPASAEDERKKEEGKPYKLKRSISVDQIRGMQTRLNTRPTLGSRRVIIIDPADELELSAANALLKSLEEPPVGSFFMLVTHRLGRLLPTLRSRCRVLRFPNLTPDQIDSVLRREAPQADEATRQAAIAAGAGSPGAALDFVELGLSTMHQLMAQIASRGDADFTLRGRLADEMGARPDRQRQQAVIDLARGVIAGRMHTVAPPAIPALTKAHADLVQLGNQAPTYNFDPGLLVMEIGTLLASLAAPSEAHYG